MAEADVEAAEVFLARKAGQALWILPRHNGQLGDENKSGQAQSNLSAFVFLL